MSTQSAKQPTRKIRKTLLAPSVLPMPEVLSSPSPSPLVEVYNTEEFKDHWSNDVRFHVARNLLHLRRYRGMSQSEVGQSMGTSQSAVARIESGQENITLDTLQRHIIGLDGRLLISIHPREFAFPASQSWWELIKTDPDAWSVVGVAVRRVPGFDQAIVGMQRPNGFSGGTAGIAFPVISEAVTNGGSIDGK